jgi:hypothetical protein
MPCLAPSEFLKPGEAAAFGLVAELLIASDYLRHVKRTSYFPLSMQDFLDITQGFGNSNLLIAFLKANNPTMSVSQLATIALAGLTKIADIITHDATAGDKSG